jgi:hypothetical protein
MNIELTTWERIQLLRLTYGQTGKNAGELRQFIRIMNVLELSDEEKRWIGFREMTDGGTEWDDTEREFELEFEREDFALLKARVDSFTEWPVVGAQLIVNMLDKLKEAAKGGEE